MERKDFIKQSVLSGLSLTVLGKAVIDPVSCSETPDETEGPFPTHMPGKFITPNIRADRMGTPLLITIAVNNINAKCGGLKGAIVDIWHCDSKGEYSEYGGIDEHGPGRMSMPPPGPHPPHNDSAMKNGPMPPAPMAGGSMQAADHKKEHFLRGRQISDSSGLVSFHSIYPGWYPRRAPHIHVHIYGPGGKSLLVTQIAFPEEISKAVYQQGIYAPHGLPDTSNMTDNVFNDSIANELATLSGSISEGFLLRHSIYVKA